MSKIREAALDEIDALQAKNARMQELVLNMDYDFYEKESTYFIKQAYKLIKQQDVIKKSSYTGDNPCGSQSNIAYLRHPYHLKISDNGRLSLVDSSKKGYNRVISHSRNNIKSEQISCIGKLLCVYIDNIKSSEKEK